MYRPGFGCLGPEAYPQKGAQLYNSQGFCLTFSLDRAGCGVVSIF